MKYRNCKLTKIVLPIVLVVVAFAFTTHTMEQPEGDPLFITSIVPYKSGMVVTQKGNKKVTIYSSDYKERLQEWSLDEIPTGVAIDGERIIVTVAGENKNGVYFLSTSDPLDKSFIATASGACAPLLDAQPALKLQNNQKISLQEQFLR